MAVNTLKCNHLMPLPFKGLTYVVVTVARLHLAYATFHCWLVIFIAGISVVSEEQRFIQWTQRCRLFSKQWHCLYRLYIVWSVFQTFRLPYFNNNDV